MSETERVKNFWDKLPKPFFCLAPMADVTDAAFRRIIAKYSRGKLGRRARRGFIQSVRRGGPDVFYTEFTSADGLCDPKGREALKINLLFSKKERPIVAQLFGANPEKMRRAAAYVASLGFDGIDINMGCPDRKVEKGGGGAALIKNPALAREIIRAAIEGAKYKNKKLPVSVKTRLGYNKDELETWLTEILKEDVAVVAIHARTRKEMSEVPAHWDRIKTAVKIRDRLKSNALVIGNGDVKDLSDARRKAKEAGCDGIMLGRAIFGRPDLFSNSAELENRTSEIANRKTIRRKLSIMLEHAKLFEKIFRGKKNFDIMKKHFNAYCSNFKGAKELRIKLMESKSALEVAAKVAEFCDEIETQNQCFIKLS